MPNSPSTSACCGTRFENSPQGHREMLAWLAAQGVAKALVALEATGHSSLAPATAARLAGHRVAMLHPRCGLEFARSAGHRNQTDEEEEGNREAGGRAGSADALVIARFVATQPVEDWQPLPPAQATLRDLLCRQADLEAQLQAEARRLECAATAPALRQSLRRSLRWLATELARLEKDIAAPLLRSRLYFPALTAIRHDPRSRAFALLKSSSADNPYHSLFPTS